MVEQTTHTRDAIALIFQVTEADQLDQIIVVATQRRMALTGAPAPTPTPTEPIVLATNPSRLELGTHVRVNSPKNYSFHNHTGLVTKVVKSNRGMKAHILCDKNQRRSGIITVSFSLLEIIS